MQMRVHSVVSSLAAKLWMREIVACGLYIYNDWPWSLIRFNHNIKRVQSIIILIYNFTTEEETTTNCNYKCKSSFFCFFFGCRVMNARNCGMLLLYIMTDRSWSGSNHVPFNANCHHQNLHHNWSTQIRLVRPVTDRLRRSWAPHGHTLHLGKMFASWMAIFPFAHTWAGRYYLVKGGLCSLHDQGLIMEIKWP